MIDQWCLSFVKIEFVSEKADNMLDDKRYMQDKRITVSTGMLQAKQVSIKFKLLFYQKDLIV